MTGGVAMILGPLGLNFGSGMTGGLAYVLRAEAEDVLHREFVALAEIDEYEENSLRRVLEEHVHFTSQPARQPFALAARGAAIFACAAGAFPGHD